MKVFLASNLRFVYDDVLGKLAEGGSSANFAATAGAGGLDGTGGLATGADDFSAAGCVQIARDFGPQICLAPGSSERSELLFGAEQLGVFARSRVLVAGLGGVGGAAFSALARTGVAVAGADADFFEASNQNRQLHSEHIGASKAEVFAHIYGSCCAFARIRAAKNACEGGSTSRDACGIDAMDLIDLFAPQIIIDAIDDVGAKTALILAAHARKIPLLSAGGAAKRALPGAITVARWDAVAGCALSRAVRSRLRRAGYRGRHKVVYSAEPPRSSGAALGSCVCATSAAGLRLASEAIALLERR